MFFFDIMTFFLGRCTRQILMLKKNRDIKKKPDIIPYNATFFGSITVAESKVKNRQNTQKDLSKIVGFFFF